MKRFGKWPSEFALAATNKENRTNSFILISFVYEWTFQEDGWILTTRNEMMLHPNIDFCFPYYLFALVTNA